MVIEMMAITMLTVMAKMAHVVKAHSKSPGGLGSDPIARHRTRWEGTMCIKLSMRIFGRRRLQIGSTCHMCTRMHTCTPLPTLSRMLSTYAMPSEGMWF